MHLTARTLYGIRTLVELADNPANPHRHARELSEKLNIPKEYLNQVLGKLRDVRIIKAKKGPRGGYKLARNANNITLREVVEVLEQQAFLSACACTVPDETQCDIITQCPTRNVLERVTDKMRSLLDEITIADICDKK